MIRMAVGQRIILVAAGAGAGIAATFNTPIGGVLFAIELMLPEISVNTFLPVAIATGTATFIGRLFFGTQPAFEVPQNLARTAGGSEQRDAAPALRDTRRSDRRGGGRIHPRCCIWLEDLFDKCHGRYLRHVLGMLLVGVLIYASAALGADTTTSRASAMRRSRRS